MARASTLKRASTDELNGSDVLPIADVVPRARAANLAANNATARELSPS
jgi:hypothetical protein